MVQLLTARLVWVALFLTVACGSGNSATGTHGHYIYQGDEILYANDPTDPARIQGDVRLVFSVDMAGQVIELFENFQSMGALKDTPCTECVILLNDDWVIILQNKERFNVGTRISFSYASNRDPLQLLFPASKVLSHMNLYQRYEEPDINWWPY